MKFTAKQIAELVQGKLIGNPDAEVNSLSKIEDGKKESITFIAKENFLPFLKDTKASIVVISENLYTDNHTNATLILVEDAYQTFNKVLNYYAQFKNKKIGIEPQTHIAETAKLGENIYIGAFSYLDEDVQIGNNTQIYPNCFIGNNVKIGHNTYIAPNVVIYSDCEIGNNCSIHSGTIIGSDGFGFNPTEKGFEKVPQLGNVIIENNVEIGSNCTIDRATLGSTIIHNGTKLDNLIHIAHNVELGEHNVIAAQTGIAGSTKIGNWNMIGGQVGIVGHIKLGNQIKIQAQSGINKDIKDGEILYGSPAINASDYRKSYVHYKNLPSIVQKINQLEKLLKKEND